MIILSPEEEQEIAKQLAGPGWYRAVGDIRSPNGEPVRLVPPTDWRYAWVAATLRHLESVVPKLCTEREDGSDWYAIDDESHPMPPPAEYPLRPRPRVSQHLRMFCDKMNERNTANAPHIVTDPPYSLIIVDEPNASNAFSYGFGPDGAGGIVVYSGFIDDVLAKHPAPPPTEEHAQRSPWLFSASPQHPIPTPEQTELRKGRGRGIRIYEHDFVRIVGRIISVCLHLRPLEERGEAPRELQREADTKGRGDAGRRQSTPRLRARA